MSRVFAAWRGRVPQEADLVCYWFVKAGEEIEASKARRAGLVATNSIRGGANRRALQAATEGRTIFDAWSDEPWVIDGAAVRVSLVCFSRDDDEHSAEIRLDGVRRRDSFRPDGEARRHRHRPDARQARTRERRGCLHGRHQGRPVRHSGRSGAGVVAAPGEPERAAQRGRTQALGERHGPDAPSGGQVDRRFRLVHDGGRCRTLRGAISARAGACPSYEAAEPP